MLLKISDKSYKSLKRQTKSLRVKKASKALRLLAGGKEELQQGDFEEFFFQLLEKEKDLVLHYVQSDKYSSKLRKLSPEDTLNMQRLLRWTGNQLRTTKRLLKSEGLDFLASFNSVEILKKEMLKNSDLISGKGIFWKDTKMTSTGIYYWCRVNSLKEKVLRELNTFAG